MLTFKVTTVGSSEGLILNKEAKRILNVRKGDTLYLTEAPRRGQCASRLTALSLSDQMALAETIMHDDREILRVLAK